MLALRHEKYAFGDFYLRRLTAADVSERYLSWLEDSEVTEFLQVRHYRNDMDSLRKYVAGFLTDNNRVLLGIFDAETDLHIGNASIYHIDWINGTFDFGYFIGEKDYWGKGPGVAVCLLVLHISFDELGLRKVFTYVESKNLRSRFVLQKLGFQLEATLKERVLHGDAYINSSVYSLNQTQWIELHHGKFSHS